MKLRTSERIIRAEWSQVIECAPGRRAGRTRRGYFKKATPCRGAASRRRTRCHARGFARARTHGRAIASPRLALSPTGAPPNPGDNFGFFGPMRACRLEEHALYMLSACSEEEFTPGPYPDLMEPTRDGPVFGPTIGPCAFMGWLVFFVSLGFGLHGLRLGIGYAERFFPGSGLLLWLCAQMQIYTSYT